MVVTLAVENIYWCHEYQGLMVTSVMKSLLLGSPFLQNRTPVSPLAVARFAAGGTNLVLSLLAGGTEL